MTSKIDILTWPYAVPQEDIAVYVSIECEPFSKSRPRFARTRNGKTITYNTRKTTDYEQMVSAFLRTNIRGVLSDNDSFFGLRCIFYRSSKQRIDCDNLIKAISDAANTVVWADDSQVVEIMSRVYVGCSNPSVDILIYRVHDVRQHDRCKACSIPIKTYKSYKRVYCSTACRTADSLVPKECPGCGKEYYIYRCYSDRHKVTFCSKECRAKKSKENSDFYKKNNKPGLCDLCGAGTSRKEYKRCLACFYSLKNTTRTNTGLEDVALGMKKRKMYKLSGRIRPAITDESALPLFEGNMGRSRLVEKRKEPRV